MPFLKEKKTSSEYLSFYPINVKFTLMNQSSLKDLGDTGWLVYKCIYTT